MATQQYGYGPNVWATAKPLGAQQFARLQQPGGATPTFKAENKYKALAAKAIGEMAYGAMMNQEAKKEQAAKKEELKAFNKKNAEMNAQRRQTFDVGFSPSIATNSNEVENKEEEKENNKNNIEEEKEIEEYGVGSKVNVDGVLYEVTPSGLESNNSSTIKNTSTFKPIFRESKIFGNWFDLENYKNMFN